VNGSQSVPIDIMQQVDACLKTALAST